MLLDMDVVVQERSQITVLTTKGYKATDPPVMFQSVTAT